MKWRKADRQCVCLWSRPILLSETETEDRFKGNIDSVLEWKKIKKNVKKELKPDVNVQRNSVDCCTMG